MSWARASGSITSPAGCSTSGTLRALHRRALGHGPHLESDDLRPRHQERHDYDDAIRQKRGAGKSGEALFFELALEDLTPRRRSVPAGPRRRPAASTAGSRWRSRPCWPTTRRARSPRPRSCTRARHAAQPVHQDPGHAGGHPGHRGVDLRGRADQRHAAVFPRAVSRGGRGVPARHRAPHRGRARSRGRLGGVAVRQPLGQGRADKVPRDAAQPPRHRGRRRTYRAYRELLDSPRWQRSGGRGRPPQRLLWASTGTKDPQASDVSISKRWPPRTPSTPCPRHAAGLCRPRQAERRAPGGRRRRRIGDRGFGQAGMTSAPSPPTCSGRGRRRSVKSWKDLLAGIASKAEALTAGAGTGARR